MDPHPNNSAPHIEPQQEHRTSAPNTQDNKQFQHLILARRQTKAEMRSNRPSASTFPEFALDPHYLPAKLIKVAKLKSMEDFSNKLMVKHE